MATQLLTPAEAGERLRVHRQTVYRMIWAGELPWTNVGRGRTRPRIRIPEPAVEAYIASHTCRGAV